MKKLRHPNVILFMGAVASLQRLCIVTEFLPRYASYLLRLKESRHCKKLCTYFPLVVNFFFIVVREGVYFEKGIWLNYDDTDNSKI